MSEVKETLMGSILFRHGILRHTILCAVEFIHEDGLQFQADIDCTRMANNTGLPNNILEFNYTILTTQCLFISSVQFMMSANSRIRFGLQIVFVCLYITPSHYHHCANFIWRHWFDKMPVRYNLSSVWARLSIFSQLTITQYVRLCVFSLTISFVMIERIYVLCLIIIIKSEVWTITHCLGLGHETMVCAVCLSIFLTINCCVELVWHLAEVTHRGRIIHICISKMGENAPWYWLVTGYAPFPLAMLTYCLLNPWK